MSNTAAKYEKYAEYQDSGIEWLGDIPSHWKVVKLSYKLRLLSGDGITAFEIEDTGAYPVYGGNGLRGFTEKYNCHGEYTLIGRQGALCGNINVAKGKFFATEHAVVVYPYENFNLTYLSEFLRFMDLGQYSVSAAQPGIAVDRINTLPIVVPTLDEQNAIGTFLDHETAKIDSLIAKQEKLIELLKEKRQAVISHAVTKGLNPDVSMKDSGVEWLGQVPEHWVKTKIKYVAELTPKKSELTYQENQLCTFVPMEKLKLGTLITDEEKLISEVIGGYTYFEDGDVLLAKVTPCFENKNMVVAQGLKNGIGFGSSEIYVLRTNQKIFAQFLYFRLQEDVFMELGAGAMTGAGGLKRVPSDFLTNFEFALPSLDEQREISDYILEIQSKYDDLSSKAESAIQLMQERRTALISSAVTGKIDVRNWQNPNHNNNEANTELGA